MMFLQKSGGDYIKVVGWAFTLSFILITFLPRSIDNTMFMDGVTYASIARNMSIGIGSFWRPFFADSFWLPYDNNGFFSGHPPLQFGIQSLLFSMIGDSTAVENIYNLLILICSVLLIARIWQMFFRDLPELKKYTWLPVLCWYAMVTVWYSIPNNFLDSTMTVFCLLSCYFQLRFFRSDSGKNKYLWLVLAGFAIFLAFLTKGPVGLYPLAVPFIFSFSIDFKITKSAFISTVILAAIFTLSMLAILSYEPARNFLDTYFQGQVVQALLQKREKTGTGWAAHFDLLIELARNVYPHLLAIILLRLTAGILKFKIKPSQSIRQALLVTLLVACSGIFPMLISVKQYPHYLLPALPFVALFFALLAVERIEAFFVLYKNAMVTVMLFACAVCWVFTAGKIMNPKSSVMATNALKLTRIVSRSSTIGICPDLYQNADIHANLQRYHQLSLTTNTDSARFILADSSCLADFDAETDSILPLEGEFSLVIKDAAKVSAHVH